jgi:hypothetical protein
MSEGAALFGGAADDSLTNLMQAYNNFTYGENITADRQAFAKSGVGPDSTMGSYAGAGAEANKVYQEVRESDAMRSANQQVANAQKGELSSGIGALGSVAKLAGGI